EWGAFSDGNHGTSDSTIAIASASSRYGVASKPPCRSWCWGKFMWVWNWSTTGAPSASASATSEATARGSRPAALTMMSGRRAPGHHRVAVRHGHGRRLVRYRHRPRQRLPLSEPLGVGLDQRGEVGARVREQVLDAAGGEQLEIGLGRAFDADLLHGLPRC